MCEVWFFLFVSGKKKKIEASSTIKGKDGFPLILSFLTWRLGLTLLSGAKSAVLPVGRGSSPPDNQPSFFHELVSVEERLWISPAASASDTSCCTSWNMTSTLPSQLTAPERTPLYLMTGRLQSSLSRRYSPRGCKSSVRSYPCLFFFFFLMRRHWLWVSETLNSAAGLSAFLQKSLPYLALPSQQSTPYIYHIFIHPSIHLSG